MKREISFKAKRAFWPKNCIKDRWVEGHYFETPLTDESTNSEPKDGWFFLTGRHRHCIATKSGCVYEIDHETVCQFTGKNDKNGKKVFDLDKIDLYLDSFDFSKKTGSGIIGWCSHDQGYVVFVPDSSIESIRDQSAIHLIDFGNLGNSKYYEVTGNLCD